MKLESKEDNLTLLTIKNHLVVSHELDDELITLYSNASLAFAESYCFKDLVPTTYQDNYCDQILSSKPTLIKDSEDNIVPFTYSEDFIQLDLVQLELDGFDLSLDIFITFDMPVNPMVHAARLLYIGSVYAHRENETFVPKTVQIGTNNLLDLVQGSNL